MLSLNLFHSYVTYLYIPFSWSKYLLFPRYNGAKTNSQKYRSQSRHRREKKFASQKHPPFYHPILTPSRSSQNLSRTSSISSPVRQACPLSKFILREIAGVNGHTHTGREKRKSRNPRWFSLCPKIRPSPQRFVAGSFDAETAALTYQRRGMRRVKDEKSGAWHGPASALFSPERVRRLRRRWIRGYKAEAAVNH